MSDFFIYAIDFLTSLFLLALGIIVLVVIYFYIVDVNQNKHAIRRNYPVIGRFRYFFERQGEFFRQYFFAMDREEMPFNRAERSWYTKRRKMLIAPLHLAHTKPRSRRHHYVYGVPFPLRRRRHRP